MKMKKISFIATVVTALLSAPTAFAADEKVRLVVSSYKNTTSESGVLSSASVSTTSTNSNVCISSPNMETEWCVPGDVVKTNTMTTQSYKANKALQSAVVELDSYGYSASEIAATLRSTGQFDEVVEDIVVKSAYTFTQYDPLKSLLDSYMGAPSDEASGSNIYAAYELIGTPTGDNIDVLVFDSGFFEHDDMNYSVGGGRSFVTRNGGVPSDNYSPDPEQTRSECGQHGLAVASIIGGTINNASGTDGITNAANIHPIRVMECDLGYASDIARGLSWASGEEFDAFGDEESNASPYEGNVGVINISIAGYTGALSEDGISGGCPLYLQDSINKASDAGWTIQISAGNDNTNANEYAPANCENVVTVGATDWDGDKAYFSNYGDNVDIVASGAELPVACDENGDMCLFSGTSGSSPVVAGIMAMVMQDTGIDGKTLEMLLKVTATKRNFGDECATYGCGAGLANAKSLLAAARDYMDGKLNTISFALNEGDDCEQAWFVDYFGDAASLCELYSVKFFGGNTLSNATYKLFHVSEGSDLNDEVNQTLVGEYTKGQVMLTDLVIDGYDFGFKICEDGECGDVFELNTTAASESERPKSCQ
jgi:serine protease